MNRLTLVAFITLFAIATPILFADVTPKEVDIGKQASAEYEKEVKLVGDQAVADRVTTVGQAVAKAAGVKLDAPVKEGEPKPDVPFTFKVVDDPDVNAFALPGGWIYINKGLVDYVQSDDELAAVLAHEVAHVVHNHAIQRQSKYNRGAQAIELATLVALVLTKDKSVEQIYGLSQMASFVNIAKTMEYSQEAEAESDLDAIDILQKTPYKPIALLTVMDRFARDAERFPQQNLGIYQSHPPSKERSESIRKMLTERGIPMDIKARRSVTNSSVAKVEEVTVGEQKLSQVVLNKKEILTIAGADAAASAERAKQVADAINNALDTGVRRYELDISPDGSAITRSGGVLLAITPADAALAPGAPTLPDFARTVLRNLEFAIEKGLLDEM